MKTIELPRLELLKIEKETNTFYGGSQQSYQTMYQRMSGCGPTTASNAMIYLAQTNPHLSRLFPYETVDYDTVLSMMKTVWKYVTPGFRGVDTTAKFAAGADRYIDSVALPLRADALDIPADSAQRPSVCDTATFLRDYLENGSPIAFLNLHSGEESALYPWHWVLIVSITYSENQILAHIYDEGSYLTADLTLWLKTTKKGGGFVGFAELPDLVAQ